MALQTASQIPLAGRLLLIGQEGSSGGEQSCLADILAAEGFLVTEATGLDTGVCGSAAPDLILAPWSAAHGDAASFVAHITDSANWKDVPVVVVGMAMDAELRGAFYRQGVADVISLPCDGAELRSRIGRLLEFRHVSVARQDEAEAIAATHEQLSAMRVAEMVEAEAQRAALERRFIDIVNTTDGIIWEADATSFAFSFVSDKAERLLGFPVTDWYRTGFWVENLHPEDRLWAPEFCASCTGRAEPHDFEYRFIARDGRTVWLHDVVTVVIEDGKPRWLRGIMIDVTARKEIEMRMEQLTHEQARHLSQLAGELTHAEQRERDRLYDLLHDEVQPLLVAVRLSLSSLTSATPIGDTLRIAGEARDHVTQVMQAVRHLSVKLNPPLIRERGLQPALEALADWVRANHRLLVVIDAGEDVEPTDAAIRLLCFNCVRELLVNVVKHAATDRASVLLRHTDAGYLRIVVADEGHGFDPAVPTSGTGLATMRRRLEMFGGSLVIDGGRGGGAAFAMTVPMVVAK